jgi:hypothetical protein
VTDLSWASRISVSDHALKQAERRLGWNEAPRIRGEVRAALVVGRVSELRPAWTHGDDRERMQDGLRFAWDAKLSRCWVLLPMESGRILVKTLLLRYDDHVDDLERRRGLRAGLVRR